jgi:hypothetical protein
MIINLSTILGDKVQKEIIEKAIELRDSARNNRDPVKNQVLFHELKELLKKCDPKSYPGILAECTQNQLEPDDEYVWVSNALTLPEFS